MPTFNGTQDVILADAAALPSPGRQGICSILLTKVSFTYEELDAGTYIVAMTIFGVSGGAKGITVTLRAPSQDAVTANAVTSTDGMGTFSVAFNLQNAQIP